jgi:hypothetical protein
MSKRGRGRRTPGRRILDRVMREIAVEGDRLAQQRAEHAAEIRRGIFWLRLGAGDPPAVG